MTTDSNTQVPSEQRPLWFQIARIVLVVCLVVAVYLLGTSMLRHRFFRGGHVDRYGVLRQ
jgi:hypothetical protein